MTVELIRNGYKQLGLHALELKKYNSAIDYFNLWQYAYVNRYNIDKYEYDIDILDLIEKQLQFDFPFNVSDIKLKDGEKIRIAYLTHVLDTPTAIMAKILIDLIKYHDKSKFEIHVFTMESLMRTFVSPGHEFIGLLKHANCYTYYAANFKFGFNKLLSIANQINKLKPHVMVTCVALADFNHFFISALKPAPIRIGFVVGPPAQFIPPTFDYGMSWFTHSIIDCPVPCINTGIIYIPEEKPKKILSKSEFGIPEDAVVIISTGRYTKFQDQRLLNIVVEMMQRLPNLHYVIAMSDPEKLNLYNIPVEIKERIHVFGWSNDYEKYLSISDIFLDTFPSGGGVTIQDAALARLPIISFTDDISKPFDQSDWNPAEDMLPKKAIILIDRYHIENIKLVIYKLYSDEMYRLSLGDIAYESIISMRSNIGDNVKKIESLYVKLVEEKLKKGEDDDTI